MSFSTVTAGIATAATVFALKHAFVTLLQVNERSRNGIKASPEDHNSLLKPALPLLGLGPSFGGPEFLARCDRITLNNAANEPVFLGLVLAANAADAAPEDLATCLMVYTGARVAHNLSYLFGTKVNAIFRSSTYVVGLSTLLYVGAGVLKNLVQ